MRTKNDFSQRGFSNIDCSVCAKSPIVAFSRIALI